MEGNDGYNGNDTADEPPDASEGMDIEGWLATTTKTVMLTDKGSDRRQETGLQFRERIVKQRKDLQDRLSREGMSEGRREMNQVFVLAEL